MDKNQIQQALEQGLFIVIEFVELEDGSMAASVLILAEEMVFGITTSHRAHLLASMIAWLFLAEAVVHEGAHYHILPDEGFPEISELQPHVERSLEMLGRHWPHEYEFAKSCIPDTWSAVLSTMRNPRPGSLSILGPFTPQGTEGMVARVPSPVSYFASSMERPGQDEPERKITFPGS